MKAALSVLGWLRRNGGKVKKVGKLAKTFFKRRDGRRAAGIFGLYKLVEGRLLRKVDRLAKGASKEAAEHLQDARDELEAAMVSLRLAGESTRVKVPAELYD